MDDRLGTLARADKARLKAFAKTLISDLGAFEVLQSRTGLVMLPMRDTAGGVAFHLGEVLVSEAHVRKGRVDGYGMRRGHDLEAAMAMALVDLALASDVRAAECAAFCAAEAKALAQADEDVLRRVEATRVNMETF
ncbi:phosphonate C-P lyase system protein PhnG [uncultured Tateyamaria sp.]|uniref:phosphonate C-P lyase system protein PhnG n=1 Tax=uncultured Tateyamaria sp. TaxID=455651 RepID=UPI0026176A12|nr:phosphonate C-P lyase system protein PhnG [uncultured Tateyamaria sp.]